MNKVDGPPPKASPVVIRAFAPVRKRWNPLILVAALVILLAAGGWGVYRLMHPPLNAEEVRAINASERNAKGFDEKSKDYSFMQLSTAVTYAYDKKCPEARAVVAEVAQHPNGYDASYMEQVKQRIEDICSGKIKTNTGDAQ